MYIYIQIYWNLLNPWVPEWSTSLKGHRCQAINLKAAGSNSVVSLDVMCCISRQNTKFKFPQSTQLQLVQAGVGGGGGLSVPVMVWCPIQMQVGGGAMTFICLAQQKIEISPHDLGERFHFWVAENQYFAWMLLVCQ